MLKKVATHCLFHMLLVDIQPDEDQEDPDERHDPESDMEVDDSKHPEESSRYFFLFIFFP